MWQQQPVILTATPAARKKISSLSSESQTTRDILAAAINVRIDFRFRHPLSSCLDHHENFTSTLHSGVGMVLCIRPIPRVHTAGRNWNDSKSLSWSADRRLQPVPLSCRLSTISWWAWRADCFAPIAGNKTSSSLRSHTESRHFANGSCWAARN